LFDVGFFTEINRYIEIAIDKALPTVVVVHPTTPDTIDQCFLSLSCVMIAIKIGIGYFFPDSQMVYLLV
jgi:hypothetical protein